MAIKYNKRIKPTSAFKNDIKSIKNNKKAISELENVLNILSAGGTLPEKYKNHSLHGEWKNHFDCHILPDLVLIYTYNNENVVLSRLGNHAKLKLKESLLKLCIKEDTACISSKTSYMNEDGLDDNGIYYFGKKPDLPKSWKDFLRQKRHKDPKKNEE